MKHFRAIKFFSLFLFFIFLMSSFRSAAPKVFKSLKEDICYKNKAASKPGDSNNQEPIEERENENENDNDKENEGKRKVDYDYSYNLLVSYSILDYSFGLSLTSSGCFLPHLNSAGYSINDTPLYVSLRNIR